MSLVTHLMEISAHVFFRLRTCVSFTPSLHVCTAVCCCSYPFTGATRRSGALHHHISIVPGVPPLPASVSSTAAVESRSPPGIFRSAPNRHFICLYVYLQPASTYLARPSSWHSIALIFSGNLRHHSLPFFPTPATFGLHVTAIAHRPRKPHGKQSSFSTIQLHEANTIDYRNVFSLRSPRSKQHGCQQRRLAGRQRRGCRAHVQDPRSPRRCPQPILQQQREARCSELS